MEAIVFIPNLGLNYFQNVPYSNNSDNINTNMRRLNFYFIFIYFFIIFLYLLFRVLGCEKYNYLQNDLEKNNLGNFDKFTRLLNQDNLTKYVIPGTTINFENAEHNILIAAFMIEMSNKQFRGKWKIDENINNKNNTNINNNDTKSNYFSTFKHKEGEFMMRVYLGRLLSNNQLGITSALNTLSFEFEIKDGSYKDNWIDLRLDFLQYSNLNHNYRNDLQFSFNFIQNQIWTKLFLINNRIVDVGMFKLNIYDMEDSQETKVNQFELTFHNRTMNIITGKIGFHDLNLNLEIVGEETFEFYKTKKISNFTLILTLIGFFNAYNSLNLIKDMLAENLNPRSFSIYFIYPNLIWNGVLTIGGFYIATSYPIYFTDFALPSIINFIEFSVLQIRILFLIWRYQNLALNLAQVDEIELRKKMFKFYFSLYFCIFISIITIHYILIFKWIILINVIITFLPQIYHNMTINITRNKIPYKTIFIVAVNKLFFSLYFRMCPYNIFETEPDLIFSGICLVTIFIEIFVLFLQSKFGALFFIPKSYRRGYYNYYKTFEEVRKINSDIENTQCSICLNTFTTIISNIENTSINNDENIINDNITNPNIKNCFYSPINADTHIKLTCKDKLKSIFTINKNNSKLMVTPCNHIFHPECLKVWAERKNECPVCRYQMPCIED